MPAWIVHLATANEVIKRIKIEDVNSFLIGNVIPDAERHVVKDFSVFVPYNISHYAEIQLIDGQKLELPNIEKFMQNYKNCLNNPMILGYLTHILADYYWNRTCFLRYRISDNDGNCIGMKLNNNEIKCDVKLFGEIKHHDFNILKNEIVKSKNYIIPKYEDKLLDNLKSIKELPLNKEDINKIIKYLKNETYINQKEEYKMFTKEQIYKDYKDCIEFIIKYLEKTYFTLKIKIL